MKYRHVVCGVLGLILLGSLVASAAVYKEGKKVFNTASELIIVKMKWGLRDKESDRLIGEIKLSEKLHVPCTVTLVFDVFSKKIVDGEPEKLDTINVEFQFGYYGYFQRRGFFEGEFCVDFTPPEGANRITLVNTLYEGRSAIYQTDFNINNSLIRTSFKLPEPKIKPQAKAGGR
jgi:hypothetical protein